ncbi:hypothetical protein HYQ46_005607 [Verticillium longisporum]|nr:hypothetical protein HYQ46_005607 [Verticillium longisporum]
MMHNIPLLSRTPELYNARLDVKHAHIFAMTMCEPINESTHRACGSDSRLAFPGWHRAMPMATPVRKHSRSHHIDTNPGAQHQPTDADSASSYA